MHYQKFPEDYQHFSEVCDAMTTFSFPKRTIREVFNGHASDPYFNVFHSL